MAVAARMLIQSIVDLLSAFRDCRVDVLVSSEMKCANFLIDRCLIPVTKDRRNTTPSGPLSTSGKPSRQGP
jgi:hypothetical protein